MDVEDRRERDPSGPAPEAPRAEHERTLDDEGVPDLEGPLPEKVATGDPQEGLAPPNDRPRASVDYGVTADEMRRTEDLDDRLARDRPDVDDPSPPMDGDGGFALVAEETDDQFGPTGDREQDLVADEAPGPGGPEERALHEEREPG